MVRKSNDDGNVIEEGFENEDDDNIRRSSKTSIEDEANEEEQDLKSFTSSELTSWEQRRESNNDTSKKNKDDSELSNDTVRMYLKEIGKVNLLSAQDEVILARSIESSIFLKKILIMPSDFSEEDIDYGTNFFENNDLNSFIIEKLLEKISDLSKITKALKKFLNIKEEITLSELSTNERIKEIIDGQKVDEFFLEASKYISDSTGIPLEETQEKIIELSILRRIFPENYLIKSKVNIEKPIKNPNPVIKDLTDGNKFKNHIQILKEEGEKARKHLGEANLRLVVSVAKNT